MLRYVISVPTLVKGFIMNGCWILSNIFLHLLRWSCSYWPLNFYFYIMISIFFIIAGLQCSVKSLLYSKMTQLYIHVWILFSHNIMLLHKWLDIVPSATQQDLIDNPLQCQREYWLCFSSRTFIVSDFTFTSLIHVEFIFVCGMRK